MTSALHFAQQGALIAPRNDLKALVVTGPDRISWLMGMLTCDLAPVEQNRAVYGLVLDKQGKVLTDLIALQQNDRLLLVVDHEDATSLQEHLDHFLIMEDAEIEVLASPHSFLLAVGPRAAEVGTAATSVARVLAARSGRLLGCDAVIILVDGENPEPVAEALAAQDEGFGATSSDQFDASRIELGLPKFDVDFGPTSYPMEAGLDEHAISFSKGCYVGQEVVVKLRSRGKPVRVLRRIVLATDTAPPSVGAVVSLTSGKEAGRVTSVGRTETGAPVAYALLRRADVESEEHVVVEGGAARLAPVWGILG
jgi:glycine cleavage system T protein (aminomethyltransferase)